MPYVFPYGCILNRPALKSCNADFREGILGGPVAFASRVPSSDLSDDDLDTETVGMRSKHLPLVSCNAAKALICIGGVAAVGTQTLNPNAGTRNH